ncbi:MAG: 3-deoxy-D-manno-octulosonic acid transferase [Rhizobiales bacterium PAR1]|nr:MAG: 3-deoxy-D-manno-octulosonic acid transferase [Rhizobiales bacterium PAR1]
MARPLALPISLHLYRAVGRVAPPFLWAFLRRRLKKGKEDAKRLPERWGRASLPRPAGTLVWLHAASVGETMSILPLVGRLVEAGRKVLLTSGTVTSAALAASRLPEGAVHQFVPLDLPGAAKRFLSHWQPDLAVFCESELWPTLMIETQRQGIPLGIINGRMSERSAKGWARAPKIAKTLLGGLAFCLAQSRIDSARYSQLGAPSQFTGNLKFDAPPLPVEMAELDALDRLIGQRPVFLAASTHPGEEALVLDAAAALRDVEPELLTVIVPRHPARSAEIVDLCRKGGMMPAVRSAGEEPDDRQMLYIADTLGELGLFYSVATVAFIGGSLVPIGGHNPIEPARLAAPIVHGPETHNFADIFAELDAASAAVRIANAAELAPAVAVLLKNQQIRDTLIAHAKRIVSANEGALATTLATIEGVLSAGQSA